MAPRFIESSFIFEGEEQIPDHDEGWAGEVSRDPSLWHLDGHDRFSYETYRLASNIEDREAAQLLARAAKRAIEKLQPRARAGSIQDDVRIVCPRN